MALPVPVPLALGRFKAVGRRRIVLARRALALSADCADAWMILGEASTSLDQAATHYERAVDAGARAIGEKNFRELAGAFWGHIATRPYMRARLALADALVEAGRPADATAHYKDVLRLNPNDNQGIRYLLVPLLLEEQHDAEAGEWLDHYRDDAGATLQYARALWVFRTEGDTPSAAEALRQAVALNRHVVDLLRDPEQLPFDRPSLFAPGSREEAVDTIDGLLEAFEQTPGALEWLERRTPPRKPRRRRR